MNIRTFIDGKSLYNLFKALFAYPELTEGGFAVEGWDISKVVDLLKEIKDGTYDFQPELNEEDEPVIGVSEAIEAIGMPIEKLIACIEAIDLLNGQRQSFVRFFVENDGPLRVDTEIDATHFFNLLYELGGNPELTIGGFDVHNVDYTDVVEWLKFVNGSKDYAEKVKHYVEISGMDKPASELISLMEAIWLLHGGSEDMHLQSYLDEDMHLQFYLDKPCS